MYERARTLCLRYLSPVGAMALRINELGARGPTALSNNNKFRWMEHAERDSQGRKLGVGTSWGNGRKPGGGYERLKNVTSPPGDVTVAVY